MNVLAVETHPDDAEFLCAGTLARLAQLGHSVSILSLTAGECGTTTLGLDEMRDLRLREAEQAAAVIAAHFHYAGIRDKRLFYGEEPRNRACEVFRRVQPDIVFALSPKDYILDHEAASMIARDAASAASARNCETGDPTPAPLCRRVPYLYYCEPVHQMDIFGNPVTSTTFVDISDVMETKERMLACHESQRAFMRMRQGMDNYIDTMKSWAANSGRICGVRFAEGFRQHVAPPFPRENLLVKLLDARVSLAPAPAR